MGGEAEVSISLYVWKGNKRGNERKREIREKNERDVTPLLAIILANRRDYDSKFDGYFESFYLWFRLGSIK